MGGFPKGIAMIAISNVAQDMESWTGAITLYFLFTMGILLVAIPALEDAQLTSVNSSMGRNKKLKILDLPFICYSSV
jgi:hypothetical protein